MPLTRGSADLLDRLDALRKICREEERYIWGEVRKLLEVAAGNKEATRTLGHNIEIALGRIGQAENDIDALIREELRPKLSRRGAAEGRQEAALEERIADLEHRIEELSRPKPPNVAEFKRKEGNG